MRGMLRPKCCSKVGVLGGEDRLLQLRRDRFVRDDLAPLNRELADDLAAGAVDARDGARRVVVQRVDLGDVPGVGEEHPARQPQHDGERKQQNDPGAPGNPDDVSGHSSSASGEEASRARERAFSLVSLLPSPLTREAFLGPAEPSLPPTAGGLPGRPALRRPFAAAAAPAIGPRALAAARCALRATAARLRLTFGCGAIHRPILTGRSGAGRLRPASAVARVAGSDLRSRDARIAARPVPSGTPGRRAGETVEAGG